MFQIKQVSKHGTANPIVARLSIQTQELLKFCNINDTLRMKVYSLYNQNIQRLLLECDTFAQDISKEILEVSDTISKDGFIIQSRGRSIHVPQIMRLESRVEQYLYSAKSVLRELAKIFNLLFGTSFNSAKYHEILKWAKSEFGTESELAICIEEDHNIWIKKLVLMRNAVEHAGGHSGVLNIHNFELIEDSNKSHKIQEPIWNLNEENSSSIAGDLLIFTTNLLEFSEAILIICMKIKGMNNMLSIAEIPIHKRNESCPVRLRVVFHKF